MCCDVCSEQPFPVDVHLAGGDPEESARWAAMKEQYNARGILLFADESMRTAADVSLLAPYVDGVNIKLEKCGGLRGALLAVEAARSHDLRVWLGCMVGSALNSTATAHLSSLACCSDLDGALLVTPASQVFSGGFRYTPQGGILLPGALPPGTLPPGTEGGEEGGCKLGIGVTPTTEFARSMALAGDGDGGDGGDGDGIFM